MKKIFLVACLAVAMLNAQKELCFQSLTAVNASCVLDIQFEYDKPIYRPESKPIIDSLTAFLKKHPNYVVEIGNHRDHRGTAEYGYDITRHRSKAIVDTLIKRGVPQQNLIPKGYGETVPRTLDKNYKGESSGYVFTKGTVLTEAYIESIDTKTKSGRKRSEDAHALNRRTEIKIISIK